MYRSCRGFKPAMWSDLGPWGQVLVVIAAVFVLLALAVSAVKYEWLMRLARSRSSGLAPGDLFKLAIARRAGRRRAGIETVVIMVEWNMPLDGEARHERVRRLAAEMRRSDDVVDWGPAQTVVVADMPPACVRVVERRWMKNATGNGFRLGMAVLGHDGAEADVLLQRAVQRVGQTDPVIAETSGQADAQAESSDDSLDPITGLLRAERMGRAARKFISQLRYTGQPVTVLRVDVDRLAQVNDRYGREAGDAVLARCAEVLSDHLRETDLLGRIGDDEFLAVLDCPPSFGEAIARRLIEEVRSSPAHWQGIRLPFGIRIGLAGIGGTGASPAHVLDAAEVALRMAERQGPGTYLVYQRWMGLGPPPAPPVEDRW